MEGGELPPRAARRERLKAEVARLFAAREGKGGSPRITADLREAGWRVSENTVAGADARAGPGRPAQEAPQGHRPGRGRAGGGHRTWSSGTSRPAGSTASGTATAPRSPPMRASCTSIRCWTWARAGSSGSRRRAPRRGPGLRRAGDGGGGPRRRTARRDLPHRPGQRVHRGPCSGRRASGWAISQSMGRPGSALDNAVIESWHSTWSSSCGPADFATRAAARAAVAAWIEDYNHHRRHSALGMRQPGGLRAVAGGKGRRVSAAGPPRGPGKGGGCAAAGILGLRPLRVRGRPSGLKGAPHRARRRPCGPPLTPQTTAAPRDRKGGRPRCPARAAGTTRPARASHDHHNRSLHGLRGIPAGRAAGRAGLLDRAAARRKRRRPLGAELAALRTADGPCGAITGRAESTSACPCA